MQDHTVTIDTTTDPATISLAPTFNIAVPFIDSHIEAGRADRLAMRADGHDITYGQLAAQTNRYGNALIGSGLEPGDRVLMAVLDEPLFLYAFWGAIKAGLVPIPVNTMLMPHEYAFLVDDSECKAVVYSNELGEAVTAGIAKSSASPVALAGEGDDSLGALAQASPDQLTIAATRPDTECFWLYSSGSTGNPKGVVHAHKDLVFTCERFGKAIVGITENDTVYSASKLFFSYGFGGGMTFPLWVGATLILTKEKTTPELTFAIIEEYRPDVFFGVPTLYGQQLHSAEADRADLSSIRIAVSAGEALPAHVFEQIRKRFGFTILDGIGSTEVLHIFVSNRLDDIKPGTTGRPVPGYEVKIVGEDGQPVATGEVGTLWVKGQSNASKYWNNPEKTAATMVGDWLNTGDMYYVDDEGYYVNAGRGDDMLKVGGMWCSPIEIEAHLIKHPKVREAAVVGRRDQDNLIKPEAYVVLTSSGDDEETITEDLKSFCKSGLAGYKFPRWFKYIDELPKTSTGKIQRFKLRQ